MEATRWSPLAAAYLLLLIGLLVQYRRDALGQKRSLLLVGGCLVWLAYAVLQVTGVTAIAARPVLAAGLNVVAGMLFIIGAYSLYRWWQAPDPGRAGSSGTDT